MKVKKDKFDSLCQVHNHRDFTTPISEVRAVSKGIFTDSDGSLYAIPSAVCIDLDDECTIEYMESDSRRLNCSRYQPSRGKCPFVGD